MIEYLNNIDKHLTILVNNYLACPSLDKSVYYFTDYAFLPLVLIILFLIYRSYGLRIGFYVLLLFIVTIFISDQISGNIIRDMYFRARPCHDLYVVEQIRPVRMWISGYCGGVCGFVSAHASNAFAMAMLSFFIFRNRFKVLSYIIIFYAALIAFSRIYLGVHFMGDIIVGAIIGMFCAYVMCFFVKKNTTFFV